VGRLPLADGRGKFARVPPEKSVNKMAGLAG